MEYVNGNAGHEIDFGPFSIFWMHPGAVRGGFGVGRLRFMRWTGR